MMGISLALAAAPGCETDPAQGGGGDGGAGGESSSSSSSSGSNSSSSGSNSSSSSSGNGSSSTSSSSGSMGGDTEPPAMNGMTAAHNAVRASVNPAPTTPIPPLTWAGDVAAVAQAHAEKCVFEHSSSPFGENIYATSGGATPQGVVGSWSSEAKDYDYANNSCSDVCGHYTQVVWAKSLRLGCGMAQCTKNSPFGGGSWELWVCNYDPPGNYSGERPY